MFFKKTPPPPPPKKMPSWVPLLTPIIFAIFIGLVTFIGNGFSEDIREVKEQVKVVEQKKVDNKTLQLMIQKQEMLIQHQRDEAEKQRALDSKKFEDIQRTQSKTLDRIEAIQAPQKLIVQPQPVPVEKTKRLPSSSSCTLTPDEFERYMNMKPDIQIKYKIYLERKGRDVSDLP